MLRTTLTALLVATGLLAGAGSAAGLSCAEPEPFDMEAAIAAADAAAIGTITSISVSNGDSGNAALVLKVEVKEAFKGTVSRHFSLDRTTTVWGPYYEEGSELALLVHDGVVTDGVNSLCGPFFYPADMRRAGGEPTLLEPEPRGWLVLDLWRGLLDLIDLLAGR